MPITACTLLIYYVSSVPGEALPDFAFHWADKVLHVVAFFVYGVACMIAVAGWRPWWPLGTIRVCAMGIGLVWAVLDEVHQMFVANRDATIADVGADIVGLGLAVLLARFVRSIFR